MWALLFTIAAFICGASASICESPGCIHSASSILQHMDPSVDPCEDFYRFACGRFINKTVIPDDKATVSTYGEIRDVVSQQLHMMLEEPAPEGELRAFGIVRSMYRSCKDTKTIEARGLEPFNNMLRHLGGWPVLLGTDWDGSNFSWTNLILKLRNMGYSFSGLIDVAVSVDLQDTSRYIIDIDQAHLGLSKEFLKKGFKEKVVWAYYEYMVDMAVALGAERSIATTDLLASVTLEMKLADISWPREKRRNVTISQNPMTIRKLQRLYPYIMWRQYLEAILKQPVQNMDVVNVNVPPYLAQLNHVLRETDSKTVANYLIWKVVHQSAAYLTDEMEKIQLRFSSFVSGRKSLPPRWKKCARAVGLDLPIAVGSMYVRRFFKRSAKEEAVRMVSYVRDTFKQTLINLDWMDIATKAKAVKKLAAMEAHVAYPNELLDDHAVESYYEKLQINENRYIESVLNISLFGTELVHRELFRAFNRSAWDSHGAVSVVNAFYSPLENSIQFPAAIFQGMFFSNNRPRYLNYGCIGFTIGHEITHGFDDRGRQFDHQGNLVNWWAPQTQQHFLNKAKCVIDQYSSHRVQSVGLNVNGFNTQGENIADMGGIKVAYRAYQKYVEDHGPEPRLPGLAYSPNQLFWINAANKWCSKYKKEYVKQMLLTDPHSPAQYRVNGPFSNSEEFAQDYNCPVGSPMNPEEKCIVW